MIDLKNGTVYVSYLNNFEEVLKVWVCELNGITTFCVIYILDNRANLYQTMYIIVYMAGYDNVRCHLNQSYFMYGSPSVNKLIVFSVRGYDYFSVMINNLRVGYCTQLDY